MSVRTAEPLRGRGRPQRLPEDPTPVNATTISAELRVGWLLATNRMVREDADLARRDRFIARLVEEGVRVDGPRLSRWESGSVPVPASVLASYERALDLPASALVTTVGTLRRAFGQPVSAQAGTPPLTHEAAEELLERAEAGLAGGTDWLLLAVELARYDRVFLPDARWTDICHRLVTELGMATGLDYLRRYEAATALLGCPAARRHLLLAVGDFVLNPDTQVVAPVLNLLTEVVDEGAGDLVLRLLQSPSRHLYRAASAVAAVKVARGHFADTASRALERHVEQDLARGISLDEGLDSLDLATQLGEESWSTVEAGLKDPHTRALIQRLRTHRELIPARRATQVAEEAAAAVAAEAGPGSPVETDMMLRRLLREALLNVHKARRHHASLLLAASPYAGGVARHCEQLSRSSDVMLAARALTVLMRIDEPRPGGGLLDLALAEQRIPIRTRALLNLGLRQTVLPDAVEQTLVARLDSCSRPERRAVLFVLGMGRSERIDTLATHPDEGVRRAASWWLAQEHLLDLN